jgi:hypothetical protein
VRHFRSILYAVVLAPAVWVLVAVGLTHDLTARGRDGFAVESFTGLVMLLLGGAAYGILVFAPISPLGPTVAGVVFLAAGTWAIEAPSAYAGVWPGGVVKEGFDLSRPGYGLAALLSVPMILTVLSVRRWRGYEPLVLPLVGQIGRARGAAAAPGTPMAGMETAVLPITEDGERTTLLRFFEPPEERTTLLRRPAAAETESTTVFRMPVDGETTTVIRSPADVHGESSTADINAEPPTVALPDERPTEDVRSSDAGEELTTVLTAGDERTADLPTEEPTTELPPEETAAADVDDEPTADAAAEETTAVVVDDARPAEEAPDEPLTEAITVVAEPVAADASDAAGPDDADTAGPDEPVGEEPIATDADADADDQAGTDSAAEDVPAAVVAQAPTDVDDPATVLADKASPAAESVDEVAEADETTTDFASAGETTYLVVADETPESEARPVLGPPGERTVVVRPAARIPGETTQMLGSPGEETRIIVRRNMDETQVIRLPDDGERTQLLRSSRVARPSEPVVFPADPPADNNATDNGEVPGDGRSGLDRGRSIAGAESPNFADDPTGRIQPPAAQPDEPARTMTVMKMERPPEDVPEIPSPRTPPEPDD